MTVIKIERDDIANRLLTLTLSVEMEDDRWLVGHTVELAEAGLFRVAGAQLDPQRGKTVTLIREST